MTDEDSDFVDDIVGDSRPEHIVPLSEKFEPWHRVRKEFVRQMQWNALTIRMLKRHWKRELGQEETEWTSGDVILDEDDESAKPSISESRKRPLNCLVIPGDDLLDIRSLWRDTKDQGCHIRYLGFNERHGSNHPGTRIHVANNAVTSLPRMATDSYVTGDRFEQIVHPSSQARRYLRQYGPYHLVNLDFCGSIFPNRLNDTQPYHEAIHELLVFQFAEQRSEWLLLLTTEVQPSVVDLSKLELFCKLARENFDKHMEFRTKVTELLPASTFQSSESTVLLDDLTESQMVSLFGVALGKWLLGLSHSAQWTVAMRTSYQYSINEEKGVVMLALAFEFSPTSTPPMDRTGISHLKVPQPKFPSECECAVKILERVAGIQDVDACLKADPELHSKLTADHADLLQGAGFDRDAYMKWVANGEA